jgi:hypothetical protein
LHKGKQEGKLNPAHHLSGALLQSTLRQSRSAFYVTHPLMLSM